VIRDLPDIGTVRDKRNHAHPPTALAWSSVRPTQATSGSMYATDGTTLALKAAAASSSTGQRFLSLHKYTPAKFSKDNRQNQYFQYVEYGIQFKQ
jgi:hypothetical protein